MRTVLVLAAVVALTACVGPGTTPVDCYVDGKTVPCIGRPKIDKATVASLAHSYAVEPWVPKDAVRPPLIGLALMGGGSQAGSFALGVLKRLVDDDAIQHVDLISSVSGGGYAALYLYGRAAYLDEILPPTATPGARAAAMRSLFAHNDEFCFGDEGQFRVRTLDLTARSPVGPDPKCEGYFPDGTGKSKRLDMDYACLHARAAIELFGGASMLYARCYQDVFAGGFSKRTRTNQPVEIQKLVADAVGSLLAAPLYWATNVAFDLPVQVSPSRFTYRTGIYRAFGHIPECWLAEERGSAPQCGPDDFASKRHADFLDKSYSLPFGDLAKLPREGAGRLPTWILNATTPTRPFWDLRTADVSNMDEFRFEFTPYGFGGRRHGYVAISPSKIGTDVMTALLASAGFVDPAQRILDPASNGAVAVATNALNLDWSTSLPNYRMSPVLRAAVSAIPAPLHALSRFDEPSLRSKIHLGDGGISRDTFGAVSLIERGVRHIFISDHVDDVASKEDRTVKMETLCKLASMLSRNGLKLSFKGHPNIAPLADASKETGYDIAQHCDANFELKIANPKSGKTEHLGFTNWKRPLWHGEIDCEKLNQCEASVARGIKIYLIKTANDRAEFDQAGSDRAPGEQLNCIARDLSTSRTRCPRLDSDAAFARQTAHPSERPAIPPYLLAWWLDGGTAPAGRSRGESIFPQDSMGVMTADNSQSLFGAYVQLGNYLAYDAAATIKRIRAESAVRP